MTPKGSRVLLLAKVCQQAECLLQVFGIGAFGEGIDYPRQGIATGGNPTMCKRSGGTIVFTNDYCSSTGMSGGNADAMEFTGSFAASAVTIP